MMRFIRYKAVIILLYTVLLVPVCASDMLSEPQGDIVLVIEGNITHTNRDGAAVFDFSMLQNLAHRRLATHTSVTDGVQEFDGFLISDILDHVGAEGTQLKLSALNDYIVTIPVAECEKYNVIAAYAMNGKRLKPADKGPLWIVYPRDDYPELQDIRYDYRWIWQMNKMVVQ